MAAILTLEEIQPLVDIPQLIEDIAAGFVLYSEGKVVVPPVGFLHFDEPRGDVHIKYGYVVGDDVYVLKMASGFYDNPSLGLPPSDGVILVFDQKTGELRVVLHDRCWLTEMRTAAAGAVAAQHLAPSEVSHIGIVGTGAQARFQLEMLRHVVNCKSCYIWGRNPGRVEKFVSDLRMSEEIRNWELNVSAADSVEELTARCNLIVTATSSKTPLVSADQVRPGTHITAMGSDEQGKQELGAEVLAKADRVVADSRSQCVHHGECFYAVQHGLIEEESILELGSVVRNPSLGRTSDDQITIADLTGVAIQDIQISKMVTNAYAA